MATLSRSTTPTVKWEDSDTLAAKNFRFLFHGPPKIGKTFFALTASEFYPKEDLPADKTTVLEDMVWWSFDAGALRGLPEMNLKVPKVIDFSVKRDAEIFKGMREALKMTRESIEKGLTKWLVVDTISKLDSKMKVYWRTQLKDSKSKFAVYDAMLTSHQRFFEDVNTLDCHVIFLSHSKANLHDDPDSQIRKKATALPGYAPIEFAVTGGAKDQYRGDADMVAAVLKSRDSRGVTRRIIEPQGGKGFEAGSRWTRYIDKEELADMRSLMAKITKGLK